MKIYFTLNINIKKKNKNVVVLYYVKCCGAYRDESCVVDLFIFMLSYSLSSNKCNLNIGFLLCFNFSDAYVINVWSIPSFRNAGFYHNYECECVVVAHFGFVCVVFTSVKLPPGLMIDFYFFTAAKENNTNIGD